MKKILIALSIPILVLFQFFALATPAYAARYCFIVREDTTEGANKELCFDDENQCMDQRIAIINDGATARTYCYPEGSPSSTLPDTPSPSPTTPTTSGGGLGSLIPCSGGSYVSNQAQINDAKKRYEAEYKKYVETTTDSPELKQKTLERYIAEQPAPVVVGKECGFNDFITFIKNIINAMFMIAIPLTAIAFTYVGILLLTAQGNTAKITQAKEIAWKVMMGFIVILGAWLIVFTITSALVRPEFRAFLG